MRRALAVFGSPYAPGWRERRTCTRAVTACAFIRRLRTWVRWPPPSNGGNHGRQITEVEKARSEAEEHRQGRRRGRVEGQARESKPYPAASGEGQEVARGLGRRCGASRGPRVESGVLLLRDVRHHVEPSHRGQRRLSLMAPSQNSTAKSHGSTSTPRSPGCSTVLPGWRRPCPVEFRPDPAEERGLPLLHDEDIAKLDGRSLCHRGLLRSPRRAHVAKGSTLPSSRCGAENGLAVTTTPESSRVKLTTVTGDRWRPCEGGCSP